MPALSYSAGVPVRNYLSWIALGLSLALNVVLVADIRFFGEATSAPKINAEKQLADEMHLSETQLEAYQFYRQQLRDLTGATRIANQEDIDAYYQELEAADPDVSKLEALLLSINKRRADLQVHQTKATVKFMTVLDSTQKEILIEATHRQQDRASIRPRPLKP